MNNQIKLTADDYENTPSSILTQELRNLVYSLYMRWQADKDTNGREVFAFGIYGDAIEFRVLEDKSIVSCEATKEPFGFKCKTKEGREYHYSLTQNDSGIEVNIKTLK